MGNVIEHGLFLHLWVGLSGGVFWTPPPHEENPGGNPVNAYDMNAGICRAIKPVFIENKVDELSQAGGQSFNNYCNCFSFITQYSQTKNPRSLSKLVPKRCIRPKVTK